jgi:septum formation protein
LTAVAVLCEELAFEYEHTVLTEICFRQLSTDEIYRYVEKDQPLDCAGSFKSEAAGISLLSAMKSDDPTAIVGLPLIAVSEALRQLGFEVP